MYRRYYRDGDPDEDGRHDDLCVHITKDYFELRVYRYNEDGRVTCCGDVHAGTVVDAAGG